MLTIDQIIDGVLAREGYRKGVPGSGWFDHPADTGGPTNIGITLPDLAGWYGRPVTIEDLRTMPVQVARDIYETKYIYAPGFDALKDDWLRMFTIDTGVLQGEEDATRALQRSVGGLVVDGDCGPKTRAAVNGCADLPGLRRRVFIERMHALLDDMLGGVHRVPPEVVANSNLSFRHGWWNRVAGMWPNVEAIGSSRRPAAS
jgi:lysozyme family protein